MPAMTKNVSKEVSQLKIFIRESCKYSGPIATSSPNIGRVESKSSETINLMPLSHTLETLCEKEVNEEQEKKEAFLEEVKKVCGLLCLRVKPDLVYYSTSVDNTGIEKNPKNEIITKTKRQREEEILMPPPTAACRKKEGKRAIKKQHSESENENIKAPKLRLLQTRSSTRLLTQTLNSEASNMFKNCALPVQASNALQTPDRRAAFQRNRNNIATVTPGPNIDAPQTILRRPNPGETAISLSGSPLLVTSEQTSNIPQITIPLSDGRVMAVLAKDGLNPDDFPLMDQNVLSRLKMLHEFLGKL